MCIFILVTHINILTLRWIAAGYIDLSKRRVSPEDITKCEERYMKSKTVASIMRHVASKLATVQPGDAQASAPPSQKKAGEEAVEKDGDAEEVAPPPGGSSEEEKLEQLYEQIAWPLGKQYGHPYDAFKLALTYVPNLCLPSITLTLLKQ